MRIEVVNTGSELLLGYVLNTHLRYLAEELFPLGLRVQRQTTVPDGPDIRTALEEAFTRADLIFITGGLGPTSDDITRDVVAEMLGRELQMDDEVMAAISERFRRRGFELTANNARQAMVPAGAQVLANACGTAPGLYLPATAETPHLFLLPGPPRELEPMFVEKVRPLLAQLTRELTIPECRIFRIAGLGESQVEELLGPALEALGGLEIGYCARSGEVDLRLIGPEAAVSAAAVMVHEQLGANVFATGDGTMEEAAVRLLQRRGETLATAESCTGGFLAHRVTNVPGASEVFPGGLVTYANTAKHALLKVPELLLKKHGAVSREAAQAMAEGARAVTGATHALATTGIAGPGGGSAEKPVGTVFIALASQGETTEVTLRHHATDRLTFKFLASQAALDLLRRRLV